MTNMFKPTKATNMTEYLAGVQVGHKDTVLFLHTFIQQIAPNLTPHFAYNMLGYGTFKYTNYKKDIIDWPIVALASQKNYISLYVCALENGQYLAETYKASLGNVSVGKSCIRFKKQVDLSLPALKMLLQKAANLPGLVGVSKQK